MKHVAQVDVLGGDARVLEQGRHEQAAQLLAEAHDAVLGAGVDLEVEALGGHDVLDELLALVLDLGDEVLPQLQVLDERVGGEDVVVADVEDEALGRLDELLLLILGGNGRVDGF